MNKKIILVAVLLLAIVVTFAACKDREDDYKVDHTVTLENGDVVDVYEDEEGEQFVTNVDGDKIPVTSDVDGFYDNVEDLITETTTKKSENKTEKDEKDSSTTTTTKKDESTSSADKEEPTSKVEDDTTSTTEKVEEKPTEEQSTESQSISIGNSGGSDSISWEDIKNPKP